jgi:hypothetical protein
VIAQGYRSRGSRELAWCGSDTTSFQYASCGDPIPSAVPEGLYYDVRYGALTMQVTGDADTGFVATYTLAYI